MTNFFATNSVYLMVCLRAHGSFSAQVPMFAYAESLIGNKNYFN